LVEMERAGSCVDPWIMASSHTLARACTFSLHSASPLTHAFSTNDHGPQHKLHFSSLSLSSGLSVQHWYRKENFWLKWNARDHAWIHGSWPHLILFSSLPTLPVPQSPQQAHIRSGRASGTGTPLEVPTRPLHKSKSAFLIVSIGAARIEMAGASRHL
jgi:hypothetical protein